MNRDQLWLETRLQLVWERGFSDLVAVNEVGIRFGQAARTRLGSIRMTRDQKTSLILINRHFQKIEIPEELVDITIAHELVHYLHGFSSPIEQKFSTPHAGGVVTKELKARGFQAELALQKLWMKAHWAKLVGTGRTRRHRGVRGRARRRSVWVRLARVRRFF